MTTAHTGRTAPTPEQIRAGWDRVAPRFDEHLTPPTIALGDDLLGQHGVTAGMQFLGVTAGSGALAISATRLGAQVGGYRHLTGHGRTTHRPRRR